MNDTEKQALQAAMSVCTKNGTTENAVPFSV